MKDSPTKTICFFNSNKSFGEAEEKMLAEAKERQRQGDKVILVTNVHSQLAARAIQEKLNVYKFRMSPLSFMNPIKIVLFYLFFRTKNINFIIVTHKDLSYVKVPAQLANSKVEEIFN